MKSIYAALVLGVALLVAPLANAYAAPPSSNPQVVASYNTGTHGIVGENDTHTGSDVVMKAGNSGTFQQWFYGNSSEDGTHGDHSVWKPSTDGSCPSGWQTVPNAYPAWGDYLSPGVTYCVMTNNYHTQ